MSAETIHSNQCVLKLVTGYNHLLQELRCPFVIHPDSSYEIFIQAANGIIRLMRA
jgi:hypothetical protein